MNICHILSTQIPPREGIGSFVYNISKYQISKGHRVSIITRGNLNFRHEIIDDIEVYFVPFLPLYPFHVHIHGIFVNKLLKSLSKEIDVFHVHSPLSPVIKTKKPIVTTFHTPMKVDAKYIELIDYKAYISKYMAEHVSYSLEKQLAKKSQLITAVSSSVSEQLSSVYGLNDTKIIGNGVDIEYFKPAECMRDGNVLCVGRFDLRKGIFDVIKCAKILKEEKVPIKIKMVGTGPLYNLIVEQVTKNNLGEYVTLLGFQSKENLLNLYQTSSIFLMPSYYEGLPTVLLEAMACKLPIIATSVSGNVDLIEDKHNGLLIPPKSPKVMAEKIIQLSNDKIYSEYLSANALKKIEEKYTWDIISENSILLYESLGV